MTEAEWLACTAPERMLAFLKGTASDRKLRYFLVACARRVLPAAPDEDMTEALAVAERFADGTVSRHHLARMRSALKTRHKDRVSRWSLLYTDHIRSVPAWHATREQIVRAAKEGSRCCAWSSTRKFFLGKFVGMEYPQEELAAQAGLLRDIFGNPSRLVTLITAWLTSSLLARARAIYDDRAFNHLPVLANGLEKAGCTDPAILQYLRQPSPHVRGCWPLDLVLGKE
jgi:hypothetical protein